MVLGTAEQHLLVAGALNDLGKKAPEKKEP
jgi:hypothetical protein